MKRNDKIGFILKSLLCYICILGMFTVEAYSAESDKTIQISEIKPPFTFTIKTARPDGEPLPGVKIRCNHPRSGQGESLVDMIIESDANGIATFNIKKADLLLDRWFWFNLADENFIGSAGVGISPLDNEFNYTLKALPAEDYQIYIVDNDNKPIAGANIWLLSDNPSFPSASQNHFEARSTAITNSQGIADLKFAQIEANVIISAKGYAAEFFRAVFLPNNEPFVVKLSKGYTISGQVLDQDNNPIKNAEISAEKENFIMNYWEGFLLEAKTDDEGKFVLENAKEGIYEIRTTMPKSHAELYTKPVKVNVENNVTEKKLKIIAERSTVIKGKYFAKQNFNMSNRPIFINIVSPERNLWEIRPDNDGSVVISGIPENAQGSINFVGVSGYHMLLKIPNENKLFGVNDDSISFNHLPKGTYEGLEVHFLLAGIAKGKVLDLSGDPLSNQELVVNPSGYIYRTNEKGEYSARIPPNEDVLIEVRDNSGILIYKCEPFKVEEGQVIEKDIIIGKKAYKLVGKNLPGFDGINIDFDIEQANDKRMLICYFDIEQRPSRSCILELGKKADELKEKNIDVILIHASTIEKEYFGNWLKENNISFTAGMIETDQDKTKFNWGAKALPWLILTDKEHIVTDEGFSINDLEEKIQK